MRSLLRATPSLLVLAACNAPSPQEAKQHDFQVQMGQFLTVCAAGPTEPGIDVSSYQGSIDWASVATAKKWAYAKATEGTGYQDPTFPANWSGMKANGVYRGAYHFFHPGLSGTAQADYYLGYVGAIGAGDLPPMLDWEVSDGVSGATASANAQAFIDEIQAKTGKPTIIYTSPGLWSGFGASGFGGNPLWVADYYNCYCDSAGYCPIMPSGWSSWVMWQYSDRGSVPGISGNVDSDDFNGDLTALGNLGGAPGCTYPLGHGVGGGGPVSGPCGGSAPGVSPPAKCGAMGAGEGLAQGQSAKSCDGRFTLVMQGDGNAVLYAAGLALWNSGTGGTAGSVLVMQGDGNLVLYDSGGCPLWASNTGGNAGATLALQDDGNLVVYSSGGTALWSSGSGPIPAAPTACGGIPSGEGLGPGDRVVSCQQCFSLVMQADGNLVEYQKNVGAIWSSGTAGQPGITTFMQPDGDAVLYSSGGCPLWSSGTGGHGGAWLAVQDDGNLVVYDSGGTALWNSNTVACAGGCSCLPPPPPDDFSVSVTPSSASVDAGGSTSVSVTTAVTSGNAESLALSVTGLPAGVSGAFSPATVTAGGVSTLTLTAAADALAGSATFAVTGTGTTGSHTATGTVTVNVAPPPPPPPADAGPDAGAGGDAGPGPSPDAGSARDGGAIPPPSADAGSTQRNGTGSFGSSRAVGGCGCTTGGDFTPLFGLLLTLGAALRRRR